MSRNPRSEVVSPFEPAIVLTVSVAAAGRQLADRLPEFPAARNDRRRFLEDCILHQSKYFGIRPIAYSITNNSLLQMLETNPEFVQSLPDADVAYRWLMLCPTCRKFASVLNEPSPKDIQRMCEDPKLILDLRERLSSVSWWMRLINQRTAQHFNKLDDLSGVFWADRFRSIRIIDNTGLLAGLAHIDASAVCNGTAASLDTSEFTSIIRRIAEERSVPSTISPTRHLAPIQKTSAPEKSVVESLLKRTSAQKTLADKSPPSSADRFRCSDDGVLALTQADYLNLVESTCNALLGRAKMNLQALAAAKLLQPDLTSESWLILVRSFGKAFSHIAGQIEAMEACRTRISRRRFHVRPIARMLLAGCSKT
jgi:hypothetical protein